MDEDKILKLYQRIKILYHQIFKIKTPIYQYWKSTHFVNDNIEYPTSIESISNELQRYLNRISNISCEISVKCIERDPFGSVDLFRRGICE